MSILAENKYINDDNSNQRCSFLPTHIYSTRLHCNTHAANLVCSVGSCIKFCFPSNRPIAAVGLVRRCTQNLAASGQHRKLAAARLASTALFKVNVRRVWCNLRARCFEKRNRRVIFDTSLYQFVNLFNDLHNIFDSCVQPVCCWEIIIFFDNQHRLDVPLDH